MPRSHSRRARFSRAVVCLLALALVFAVTQARLSQYEKLFAPTGAMANSVKVAESRFQKLCKDVTSHAVCADAAANSPVTLLAALPDCPLLIAPDGTAPPLRCPLRI